MPSAENDRHVDSASRSASRRWMGASILLFLVSLALNAYGIDHSEGAGWNPSVALLLVGWLGVFEGVFAWLANPLLVATWCLMRSRRRAAAAWVCSLASLAFALSFLLQRKILRDAAGNYSRITGYGPGYWLWVACIVTAVVGCTVAVRRDRAP